VALRADFGQSDFLITHKEIKTDYMTAKRKIASKYVGRQWGKM
jgi:hypothetical protein